MSIKKQLIFEEKSHLSKVKPDCANSCHNMGTIQKNQSTGLTVITPLLLSLLRELPENKYGKKSHLF